jgi:CPA2 family monovalent cation:H+ antiporter-2
MHDVNLLITFAMALLVAFIGGVIARRIGLPPIVGYLLGGIVIGPFTPGFVGDAATISQLAELGVIFLMFGVGLHFSFQDLWRVRTVAIPGALLQIGLATLLGFGLSQMWGWSPAAGIVMGLAISVASTVVLLRGLMDHGLLSAAHGQAAIGWLIFEDLLTVLILVLMPTLAESAAGLDWKVLGLTLLKASVFVVVLFFAGKRLIPWLLLRIAHTRSRELRFLLVLTISLGTAVAAAEVFGVSLALGAFVAGVVVNESPLSHQVAADILPFQEIFSVLFFVSVGMLVNPQYLLANLGPVLALTALVVLGKPLIVFLLGLVFPWPAGTVLVVAAGLSQIGEFSFILGQAGISLGLLKSDQYSLILAVALISITLNPVMYRLITPLEKLLRRSPRLWRLLDRQGKKFEELPSVDTAITNHVVIVGFGRVGKHIATLLGDMRIPYLIVHADPEQVDELKQRRIPNLYGDAANSEVLTHTDLKHARALVVAGSDQSSSEMVVAAARDLAPTLPIIARASSTDGIKRLVQLGAQYVIHPELEAGQLEAGLEIVRHTLLQLGFPIHEITRYTDSVRQDRYDLQVNTEEEHRLLRNLIDAVDGIEVTWRLLPAGNPIIGQTLAEGDLRTRTGASVVAIYRGKLLMANPKSLTVLAPGDRIGFIGDPEQTEAVEELLLTPD